MAPVQRRRSLRLAEKEALRRTAGDSRVVKPERKGRVVASRYMNSTKPRPAAEATPRAGPSRAARTESSRPTRPIAAQSTTARRSATSTNVPAKTKPPAANREAVSRPQTPRQPAKAVAVAATPRPAAKHKEPEVPGSSGLYTEYIQWCLLEARSQREFDEAKRAANSDLQRLVEEAEAEKRALAEEQRKCKLMQELTALAKWLKDNRQFMADMKDSIDKVKDPYLQFAARLRETTRAIPLSGVHFESGEALVRDMEHYMETVRKCFSSDEARDAFKVAELLRTYYGEINEEAELLSECKRLKESLAVSANMAVSGNLRLRDSE